MYKHKHSFPCWQSNNNSEVLNNILNHGEVDYMDYTRAQKRINVNVKGGKVN